MFGLIKKIIELFIELLTGLDNGSVVVKQSKNV